MDAVLRKLHRFFRQKWRLAVLHPEKGRWIVQPHPKNIPYLKALNASGCHILLQPVEQPHYLLADDLSWETVCRHHRQPDNTWRPGRMVVETSPRNFQVWIRSAHPLDLHHKRILLHMLHSDPAADPNNRFGRCPGFRNRKPCHRTPDGQYPLSRLIWVDYNSSAIIPQHLFQAMTPSSPQPFPPPPPEGAVCLSSPPSRSRYLRATESETDFAYVLALLRRGYSEHAIRSLLIEQRTSWDHHQGERRKNAYINRTIAKAKTIIQNKSVQITPKITTNRPG